MSGRAGELPQPGLPWSPGPPANYSGMAAITDALTQVVWGLWRAEAWAGVEAFVATRK